MQKKKSVCERGREKKLIDKDSIFPPQKPSEGERAVRAWDLSVQHQHRRERLFAKKRNKKCKYQSDFFVPEKKYRASERKEKNWKIICSKNEFKWEVDHKLFQVASDGVNKRMKNEISNFIHDLVAPFRRECDTYTWSALWVYSGDFFGERRRWRRVGSEWTSHIQHIGEHLRCRPKTKIFSVCASS